MVKTLPNQLIPLNNPDKFFHEKVDDLDFSNISHPARLILCANPNTGKTMVILNLLLHKKPPFDKIYLIHNDPTTKEYDMIDCEILEEIPPIEEIDKTIKNLIIIEDIDYKAMNKEQKSLLDRYFGRFSTHCNVSIWLTAQDAISIPPTIRRMASHVILGRSNDINHMSILSSRFGLSGRELKNIFDTYMKDRHDTLIIDSTRPNARYRKNIFNVLPIS